MDDKLRELIRKMTEGFPGDDDDLRRLEFLRDQLAAYRRYLPARVVEKINIDPKAKRIEGERRVVTIAFADLSGFTALSETMDAEDIAAVINDFFTRMVKIVFKYGGSVDKFLGDALMVLFGAPVAHHDDPERAVRASLEMQREMDRFNAEKKFDPPLGMSIGVNTGPVVALNVGSDERMEYTVIGDAVNLAARLEAVSTRGEIIISNHTYEKVAEVVDAEHRPSVRVKGKKKPIQIYLVKDVRDHYRLPEITRVPVVGRVSELQAIDDTLTAAERGLPAVIGIVGDPGSGKTRLGAEAEVRARRRNHVVLSARSLPYEAQTPYIVIINLLYGYFGLKRDAAGEEKKITIGLKLKTLDIRLDRSLPYLAAVFGMDFPECQDLPPEELKKRIFAALRELVLKQAELAPLLIHVDDLQWADPTSLEFFDGLFKELNRGKLAFLFGYRSDFAFPWMTLKNFKCISLAGFSSGESRSFLRTILDVPEVPDPVAQTVYEKSQGNPLFIEEIVKLLVRKGGIRKIRDGITVTERFRKLEIAESLSSLILDQIDRLNERDRRILQYASVLGRTFSPLLLARILKIPEPDLTGTLERFEHFEGLLLSRPDPLEYDFISPTTHEVVYGSLFKARRRELHGEIGAVLEESYSNRPEGKVEALAYHFGRSQNEAKGVRYLKSAADKTYRLYALKETLSYFESALGLLNKKTLSDEETVHKSEILKRQGWVLKLAGDFPAAVRSLKQSVMFARRIGSRKDEAAAEVNLGIVAQEMGEPEKGLKYFTRAERLAHQIDDRLIEAQVIQNIGGYYLRAGELEKAYRQYQRVLELDKMTGNRRGTAFANLNIGNIFEKRGDLPAALDNYQTAHKIFEELGEKENAVKCLNMTGLAKLTMGNAEEARNDFQAALDLAIMIGDKIQEGLMLGNLGLVDAQAWRLDQAHDQFARSLELAQSTGDPVQLMLMNINIGDVRLFQGDLAPAADGHTRAVEIARKINDPFNEGLARRSLAWDHYYLGKYCLAREEFEASENLFQKIGDRRNAAVSSAGRIMVALHLEPSEPEIGALNGLEAKARERKDPEILALVMDIKLDRTLARRDYPTAITIADELFELAKKTGQKRLYAWTMAKMALTQAHQDNIEAARITLEKADRLAGALGDRLLEAECLTASALIREKTSDRMAARAQLKKALALTRSAGAREHSAVILHRLIKSAKHGTADPETDHNRDEYIKNIEEITADFGKEEKIRYLKTLER
jgi:class 3 adenylate cyclase/tetratricopeptide (TPR) repeat protein